MFKFSAWDQEKQKKFQTAYYSLKLRIKIRLTTARLFIRLKDINCNCFQLFQNSISYAQDHKYSGNKKKIHEVRREICVLVEIPVVTTILTQTSYSNVTAVPCLRFLLDTYTEWDRPASHTANIWKNTTDFWDMTPCLLVISTPRRLEVASSPDTPGTNYLLSQCHPVGPKP